MSTFLNDVEGIIKKQGEKGLIYLENYYGLELQLFREDNKGDTYADAYGSSSGGTVSKIKDFIGVLQGDDFIQKSDHFAGNFEEGFLYTREVDVRATDVIKITNSEGVTRKFKVDEVVSIGFTTRIFTQWKLINLGD